MRRRNAEWKIVLVFVFVVLIGYEEINHAEIRYLYKNYYRRAIFRNITVHRSHGLLICSDGDRNANNSIRIGIVTVLRDRSNFEEYRLAQESAECFALYHRYKWIVVDLSASNALQKLCPQHDFMFARHCVTAEILEEESNIEWFLFIDADMGVINPNHLIEEWIDDSVNLIFYDRIFNHEVMAGSYLVKNTRFSREFLRFWANYEQKLPHSTHGSDNGAIHNVILELILPEKVAERQFCEKIWRNSESFGDLSIYEACVRSIIGEAPYWRDKLRILPKGRAWARDTWLTDSMWSKQDFILHGWQKRRIDGVMFAGWPSPFVSHKFNLSLCTGHSSAAITNWKYKDTFVRSDEEVRDWLSRAISASKYDYEKALRVVATYRKHEV